MTNSTYFIDDFKRDQNETITSPSQHEITEPATKAGFSFMNTYGDKTGTFDYKPAAIYRGKKWFVYYSFRHPDTGKFRRFRVYEDLNRLEGKEKNKFALLLQKAINHGLKSGYNPFEGSPLKIIVKNWSLIQGLNYFKQNLYTRGLRKRSQQSYESVLKFLYEFLAPVLRNPINEITKQQIGFAFKTAYEKRGWSNTTFNNYVTLTRAIFNYLIEEDIASNNPAKIKPLPESIRKHKYFSDEVFARIKKHSPPDLLRFIMFLYHTGTRPNEARQLKYENILRDRKLLFIPAAISKNKKDDYIPLSNYVLENYRGTGLIFPVSVNFYGQKFNKLKKKLKLPAEYTLYSIKHSRALHLAQDNADPYEIMQLFRHSGLHITMAYLRDLGVNIGRQAAEKGIRF